MQCIDRVQDAIDAGEEVTFEFGRGIGDVEAGDATDRGLQVVEAAFRDASDDLRGDRGKTGDSATTTARPVRRTSAQTVSSSKGTMDRRSTTPMSRPSAAACSAAVMATGTDGP